MAHRNVAVLFSSTSFDRLAGSHRSVRYNQRDGEKSEGNITTREAPSYLGRHRWFPRPVFAGGTSLIGPWTVNSAEQLRHEVLLANLTCGHD